MSVLVVGLSHHSAPLPVLERAALDATAARALAASLPRTEQVDEAVVLATCNRLEVYAEVTTFHGGLAEVGAALAAQTGIELPALTEHLYVHYDDQAVGHLFAVSAGLDSMAVGETQVLGQVRAALRRGQEDGTVGRVLDPLLQQALRVGKRAHTETGLDGVGRSLVEVGLAQAERFAVPLARARALVVGAGAMSALAATTLRRLGAGEVVVANRTAERAQRLADAVGGTAIALADRDALVQALAGADVVLSCTGAVGHVLDLETVTAARTDRLRAGGGPQLVVDLALPRDVAPEVGGVDGVVVLGLDDLGRLLAPAEVDAEVGAARAIVDAEVQAYLASRRAAQVGPTVAALRSYARDVVAAELDRLRARLGPTLDARTEAELEQAVHRVVEKLLHTPTVQVKRLAAGAAGSGADYAAALRELFDLDLGATASVRDVLAVAPEPAPLDPRTEVAAALALGRRRDDPR